MDKFLLHYEYVFETAQNKLQGFEDKRKGSHGELLEEMAFCLFAANSSAKMGLIACDLIRNSLNEELEVLRSKVYKKVRFYNKRIEYFHHNREYIKQNHEDFSKLLSKFESETELRRYFKDNLKGFGMKESSHFLRNTGYKGFAIIDKHVIAVLNEVFNLKVVAPKTVSEYEEIEAMMKRLAEKHGFDFDVLDLAMWSYKTGEIIK